MDSQPSTSLRRRPRSGHPCRPLAWTTATTKGTAAWMALAFATQVTAVRLAGKRARTSAPTGEIVSRAHACASPVSSAPTAPFRLAAVAMAPVRTPASANAMQAGARRTVRWSSSAQGSRRLALDTASAIWESALARHAGEVSIATRKWAAAACIAGRLVRATRSRRRAFARRVTQARAARRRLRHAPTTAAAKAFA